MSKKWKITIFASVIVLLLVIVIDVAIVAKYTSTKRKNQEAADKVIALINKVDDNPITLESENLLVLTQAEYDVLTDKQKSLVTNYAILEKGFEDLQKEKDKKVGEDLANEIEAINESMLTAEDVIVANLMKKYDGLTKAQQSYVSNYDLLVRYKNVVDKKIAEKKQRDSGIELAENFQGYTGKWGNFGGHADVYQGMIEEAIRRDVSYKECFQGDVNNLDFVVGPFTKSEANFSIGVAYFDFWGKAKGYDFDVCLSGAVIIKQDGTIYCKEGYR